ncbi:MAG: branched-chain amino acid ABC transporter permease [Gammaproteobacteria bacterium]|nr:branched-chain amino acid ABC transporter permease [Gammaproteobacteria bacterium]NIR82933.1 branched-chain amino acid ABC transporter permease [Gammaproteobacteria bacterium]NIR90202.1 branched-chain amino acid ABC transporter permease [Gammaproteobacteria bacterium]NIU04079.1 branched-chain amino acid ABC transporter permease [Gammaproteobacteria bacterium]NIV51068.1 branched-chain amino acid ABC transporter permease [Gammaproteobacteria bacterium]
MELLVQALALGVLLGGIYALLAVGLSLVFGVLRIVNFAHGELAMLGSYGAFFAAHTVGLPAPVALLGALLVGGLIGYLINATMLRPVFRGKLERPGEYAIIVTFILSQVLLAAAVALFGTSYRNFPSLWETNLNIGGWVFVSGDRVVAFGAALALMGLLLWLVYYTDIGRAWRALTQNPLGARVVGVNVLRYANLAFATAGALAGIAAALLAPLYFIYPTSGMTALVKGFMVVIIGGLGSIWGAIFGGLALGLVETLGAIYISSAYSDAYGFLLMIVVLLLFPHGIFGKAVRAI